MLLSLWCLTEVDVRPCLSWDVVRLVKRPRAVTMLRVRMFWMNVVFTAEMRQALLLKYLL